MRKDWPKVRLGEILTRSEESIALQPDVTYREITVKLWGKGVVLRGAVTGVEVAAQRRYVARQGQFILSRIDARNGALGIVPPELDGAVVTNDFPVFRVTEQRLLPAYLGWMSRTPSFVEECLRASEGTTNRVRLQEGKFLAREVRLPPLAQQRQVVARIEELAAQIHDACTLRHQAAEEAEALENRAAEQLFNRLLASGVEAVPFEAACNRVTVGHVSSMKHAYRESGVPFLRSQNVRKNRFEPKGLSFIAPEFHTSNLKSALNPGEVVIVRTGFVGVACVIPASLSESNCADLVIVRPSKRLDPYYASHFLNSPSGRDRAALASVGSAQKHYNVGSMKKTLIPLPPLSEQRRIVSELDALQAEMDALKRLQTETAVELDALVPTVLDRAFKGEL